jgi:hypothetical protein
VEAIILDQIPFSIDLGALMARLHVRPDSPSETELRALVDEALAVGRPRALFGMAFVEAHGDSQVVVDGVTFTSRLVAVNLRDKHRVFPYLATCGAELGDWAHRLSDVLHQFWGEEIKSAALANATRALHRALEERFEPRRTAAMNPGSLPDWPLREQGPMFALLAQADRLGVTLNESFLMSPNKSVTGLRFATESRYENCQLCPRPACPGRRAPYDPHLWQRRYVQNASRERIVPDSPHEEG